MHATVPSSVVGQNNAADVCLVLAVTEPRYFDNVYAMVLTSRNAFGWIYGPCLQAAR